MRLAGQGARQAAWGGRCGHGDKRLVAYVVVRRAAVWQSAFRPAACQRRVIRVLGFGGLFLWVEIQKIFTGLARLAKEWRLAAVGALAKDLFDRNASFKKMRE